MPTTTLATASATATAPPKGVSSDGKIEHTIGIAGLKVVHAPDTVRTVLGSCVGVAIYDRRRGVGAMGHVILPDSAQGTGNPGKFADTAIEMLIEQIVAVGAIRRSLEAKIAGGAAMFGAPSGGHLGKRNIEAVRKKLAECGIPLKGEAVGGGKGRKMFLVPATGEVHVEIIGQAAETI